MPHSVCPWWIGYILAGRWRRLFQDPAKILGPYIRPGMTVLEPGPGMGFFTLDIARLVGSRGRVVVVDIQPKMLASLKRRANRAGVAGSIDARVVAPETMALDDLAGAVDFVVAIAMVHELPNGAHFFEECAASLKPGGGMLLVEPAGHVKPDAFGQELEDAARFGLAVEGRPQVWRSHAAVLRK